MYQKIASATRATVMIHRTMSLLRFFSSAIGEVQHTSCSGSSAAVISPAPCAQCGVAAAADAPARLYPVSFTISRKWIACTWKCSVSSTRAYAGNQCPSTSCR